MPQYCEKKNSLGMKQVSQHIILQTLCILHHTYTSQVREGYSFLIRKDSILVQEAGLELSGERIWPEISQEVASWCLWG